MTTKICKYKKKFAVFITFVILTTSLSPIFAKTANAQWVVWDPGNFVPNTASAVNTGINAGSYVGKEFGFDSVAWVIVNLIIERIAASTVEWINRGFQGKPAFVTDPTGYFAKIGSQVAGQFISSNPHLNALCGPLSVRVKIALAQSYSGYNETWQCTLEDAYGNMEDFINDFERGGWDKFFRLTQEPQNNPLGAYLQAEGTLARAVAQELGEKEQELNWGKGFMSFQTCERYPLALPGETEPSCIPGTESTQTPGSVIEERLNSVLGIGDQKLAVADEFNEIVSALLNQLVSRVIGAIGGGLRGLSSEDPANEYEKFTDTLSNSSAENFEGYGGQTQNTQLGASILNNLENANRNIAPIPTSPIYPGGSAPANCDPSGLFCETENAVIPPPVTIVPNTCNPATSNCEVLTTGGGSSAF